MTYKHNNNVISDGIAMSSQPPHKVSLIATSLEGKHLDAPIPDVAEE